MNIKEFALRFHGLVIQRHQMKWLKFVNAPGKRKILLAPRGHGKTTAINQIWLSWVIANNPSIRALLISHSKDMAESFSRTIRNVMENPDLQEEFNFSQGSPWRANSWRLAESPHSKPTLETKGAMGRMAGWRGDMIIFDDLLDTNTVATVSLMRRIDNWIKTDVLNALNPSDLQKVVVVGTRKHIEDWYSELLLNPNYQQRTDRVWDLNRRPLWPFIIDEHGDNIAPRYTREIIEGIREEIGPLKFAQEYLNEPSPPEGLLFRYEWLRFYENLPSQYALDYYMGIDPSHGSKRERASYFATCVVAHDKVYDKIYVVDLFRKKLSQEEQVQHAIETANKYAPSTIFVEACFQYTHVYDAMRDMFRNVVPVDYIHSRLRGTSAVNKEERIKNICAPAVETGKVVFPRPDLDPMMKTFLNYEYVAFPIGDDDMFDALTLAIHRLVGMRHTDDMPFFFPDT